MKKPRRKNHAALKAQIALEELREQGDGVADLAARATGDVCVAPPEPDLRRKEAAKQLLENADRAFDAEVGVDADHAREREVEKATLDGILREDVA